MKIYISNHISKFFMVMFIILIVFFQLWSLLRYPAPFVDEAWVAARSWAFIETGHPFGPLDQGVFERFEGHWTFFPYIPTIFMSWGMMLFNIPTLFGARIVSLSFGLILLYAVYHITLTVEKKRLALISVLLLSLSVPFLNSAHLARYDIYTAAFGFLGIALYIRNKSRKFWLAVLSGLCLGIAFEAHSHGAIFILTIFVMYFIDLRWNVIKHREFWGFVLGMSLGFLLYLILHVFPYPEGYFRFNRIVFGPTHLPPIITFNPKIIIMGVIETISSLIAAFPVTVLLIPWMYVTLLKKNSKEEKRILYLVILLIIWHGLLIRNKHFYYIILLAPITSIAVADFLITFYETQWNKNKILYFPSQVMVWGITLCTIGISLIPLIFNSYHNYQLVQNRINQVVIEGDVIMGPQTFWFGLYDHPYYSWENLIYHQRYKPDNSLEDCLEEYKPDIVIVDNHWRTYIKDNPDNDIYLQNLHIPKAEFENLLELKSKLITSFNGGEYGQVQVYRINW